MAAMDISRFVDDAALAAAYWDHVEALIARHNRALEVAGASHAVIFSGSPKLKFLDDNYYSFQANPHFVSWLPLTGTPFCYLVHTPGETPVLIYYQEKDYWHLPPAAPDGYWTAYFDVRIVHTLNDVAALRSLKPTPRAVSVDVVRHPTTWSNQDSYETERLRRYRELLAQAVSQKEVSDIRAHRGSM